MNAIPAWTVRIANAAMIVFSLVSVLLNREEQKEKNELFTLRNARGLSVFFLAGGMILSLPAFINRTAEAVFLGFFSSGILFASLFAANQRVRWDATGFCYRTAFRREYRYDWTDVKNMRMLGLMGGTNRLPNADLLVRVEGRVFLLDSTTGWGPFAAAYAAWQTQNHLPSWKQTAEERKWNRYRRHGPFARKLDRIPAGRFMFWVFLLFGTGMGGAGAAGLFFVKRPMDILLSLFMLGLFSLGFPYAAAHLDDRPKLIRLYVQGRIQPDPEKTGTAKKKTKKKGKVYRKTRR